MANEPEEYELVFIDSDDPEQIGCATISKRSTIAKLRQQIQSLLPLYAGASPTELALFQVDIPDKGDLTQKIVEKSKDLGSPLRATYPIYEYYASPPPAKMVHILVRCSASPHDELRE
ncbi:hypothetical protein PIIN_10134 [Serendipita indica DSM 11827]|uniref:Crinkler effector protein N-terminal domain-containing protein n=1 Tax=Serendipita indica (strain DSM 11827) TaxID=1109443 RepID=G4TXU1_SERID|nr:hypothetical protein PIIN_10134 [Serendipita indica DSM 11827]